MDETNRIKPIRLARGRLLRIEDGAGGLVRVRAGELWVTEEGAGKDHVLHAGQWLRLESNGATLAQALKRSVVTVVPPETVSLARRLCDAVLALLFPPTDRRKTT